MKPTIVRFTPPERWMHNVIMFCFILLLTTGLTMIYFNITGESREVREFLKTIHEIFAVMFMAIPLLILIFGGTKIWKQNIKIATTYKKTDIEWLLKTPIEGIMPGVELPPQDKFNAGQKLWIAVAVGGSSILVLSGLIIWLKTSVILALFIHTMTTMLVAPALAGHMFMALINPGTRKGITAIIDGETPADFALAHHPIWVERMAKERVLEKAERRALFDDAPAESENGSLDNHDADTHRNINL
jgi:formate dehydrogenase subunit gamma